ncbi:MAG: hypothetical protein KGJ90_00275 [Patescibacteria group bacterium]|nr:hypothetical protein [Patescibacteria group bacterium]
MNTSTIAKYVSAALAMASVFYLVLIGKIDVQVYETMVNAALVALGVHGVTVAAQNRNTPKE